MKKRAKSAVGFLFILGLVGLTSNLNLETVRATDKVCSTVEECDALIGNVNEQISGLEEISKETEKVKGEITEKREALNDEVRLIKERIRLTEEKIEMVEADIELKEAEIQLLNEDIEEKKEFLFAQARLQQRTQKNNIFLTVLSESESLTDLIKNFRQYHHFANYTKEKMDEVKKSVSFHKELQYQLVQQKAVVVEESKNLESSKEALEVAVNEAIAEEQRLMRELQALNEQMMEAQEVKEIIEAQRQEIIRETNEVFGIPMQTGYVTCEFGCYVDANGIPHNGIDLGNYGDTSTPILASASGKVIRSGWHHAYGNHVIISHNINGEIYTTVYAHMHRTPYVSTGDYVSKGQQIGTMGNTGNSTGAHLHFELYEGYYNWPHSVNPREYINFPSRW